MKDAYSLIWVAVGLLIGAAIGFFTFLQIFRVAGEKMGSAGGITLLAAIGLVGGLGVLGGYLATLAVHKADRSRRKKQSAAKRTRKRRK